MSGPVANRADPASPVDLADLAELRWTWRVVDAGGRRHGFDDAVGTLELELAGRR
jgi:hypothetical protein